MYLLLTRYFVALGPVGSAGDLLPAFFRIASKNSVGSLYRHAIRCKRKRHDLEVSAHLNTSFRLIVALMCRALRRPLGIGGIKAVLQHLDCGNAELA